MLRDRYSIDEQAAYTLKAASEHIRSNQGEVLDAIDHAAQGVTVSTLATRFPVYACAVERAFDLLPEAFYGDGKSMVNMEGALIAYANNPAETKPIADLLQSAASPTIHRLPERPRAAA